MVPYLALPRRCRLSISFEISHAYFPEQRYVRMGIDPKPDLGMRPSHSQDSERANTYPTYSCSTVWQRTWKRACWSHKFSDVHKRETRWV